MPSPDNLAFTVSRAIITLTEKCLPMSRRKLSTGNPAVHSRLSAVTAPVALGYAAVRTGTAEIASSAREAEQALSMGRRLFGADSATAFKDLGLVIIDEEQHFGVSHKERLKQLRSEVHVLTLTATPGNAG